MTTPSPPDWRGLCEELADTLERAQRALRFEGGCSDATDNKRRALVARARTALAQPEPEVVAGPTDEGLLEIRDGAYCPSVDDVNDEDDSSWQHTSDYIRWLYENGSPEEQQAYEAKGLRAVFEAGRRWGRPSPAAEGEVARLVGLFRGWADVYPDGVKLDPLWLTRAADLLSQRHPTPVPVAERLPGPGDCDAEGRFWAWCKATKEWCLLNRWHYREESERNAPGWASGWPYWLPATALPLPQGEVQP